MAAGSVEYRVKLFKEISPHMILLDFKFLLKIYILNIIMTCSKALLSAKFIICDGHRKLENLRKYIYKSVRVADQNSHQKQILDTPSNQSDLNKVIS